MNIGPRKFVAEIGNLIGVDCAQVELARYTEDVVFGAGTGDRLDDGQAYRNRPDQLGTHLQIIRTRGAR